MAELSPVFLGEVKEGKLLFQDKDLLKTHIESLEGKEVDVVIRRHRKERSHRQNRYYWVAVVGIPAQHFGYLPEEMHDAFKMLFLRWEWEGKRSKVRSTTQLTTVEFSEYVEKCRQWCAEQDIFIPNPQGVSDEQGQMF